MIDSNNYLLSPVIENIPSVTIVEVIPSVDAPTVDVQMRVLSKPKLPSKDKSAKPIPFRKSARQKER